MLASGVIEGFYGRPWTEAQRIEMMDWIAAARMNLYVYAPKDDVKLRARWREPYTAEELAALARLAEAAKKRGLTVMAALAPCLDIAYGDPAELSHLLRRLDQFIGLGLTHFALLFDDIPSTLRSEDAVRFPSFAAAQCHVANAAWAYLCARNGARLFFCPTEYCGRMAGGDPERSPYLQTLGAELGEKIDICWTGPEIISPEITADSLRRLARVLRRKPVIWENFHANDYDIRRAHAGPLGGRESAIRDEIAGFISNPNNAFEANFVPVHTTGAFLTAARYDEAEAAEAAGEAWRVRFRLAYRAGDETLKSEEVGLLIDLLYQPFRAGPQSAAIVATARALLNEIRPDTSAPAWRDGQARVRAYHDRVAALFDRMTELENRDLFYTFQPHLWEVREELHTLMQYLDWLATGPAASAVFPEAGRLPNTYRQGLGADLQALLPRDRGGNLSHVPPDHG
jgi:protein O-GlcNAcase/histone acetyltransferase